MVSTMGKEHSKYLWLQDLIISLRYKFIRDSSKMEKWMVMEPIKLIGTFFQGNLIKGNFMGMEDFSWKMEISMKVNFWRENLKVKENWAFKMVIFIEENLRMI